jgi:outer membrane protein OmpA-like peptidoglycan-associated protein
MRTALFAVLLCAIGCASAYDETYARETEMLEQQEQARQAEEAAAHAEARRYAAVVYFDVNGVEIKDSRELDWFVKQMQPYPQAIIQVQGFADSTGAESLNQQLSEQRAASVARYLGSAGIDPSRIRTEGFASEYAARPNVTAEGRERNRRVEVTVR